VTSNFDKEKMVVYNVRTADLDTLIERFVSI
jgi:hypothetical protein